MMKKLETMTNAEKAELCTAARTAKADMTSPQFWQDVEAAGKAREAREAKHSLPIKPRARH